jgi:transposase-like protein
MLVELKLVEQRYRAVIDVLDGMTVTDVALLNGVTRQTVHTWLRNYASGGMAALGSDVADVLAEGPLVAFRILGPVRTEPGPAVRSLPRQEGP